MLVNIRVVNGSNYDGMAVYVGRPSILGNPYSHVPSKYADFIVRTREAAVAGYREWLEEKLRSDNEVSREFWGLVDVYRDFGGLTLSCRGVGRDDRGGCLWLQKGI